MNRPDVRKWWNRFKPSRNEMIAALVLWALLYALLLWAMNTPTKEPEVILNDDGTALPTLHLEDTRGWQ